jgi:cytochrome c-type biogenesis protein CcmH
MRALLTLVLALALLAPAGALAQRASLTDIEDEVMCVTCNVPLNVAESPQADRQRAYIRDLIDQGKTKDEIKDELVGQYGDAVLATPEGGSFDWAAWAIPAALIAALLGGLALLVPRWRKPAGGPSSDAPPLPALSGPDARRLEEDLARYDR